MLTESDRILLTEDVLGEEWDYSVLGYGVYNRTFTCWQDTGDLKDKIVEMGKWDDFVGYVWRKWPSRGTSKWEQLSNWLMNKDRFPELVVGWWKGKH